MPNKITDNAKYVLFYSNIDDWQFAYKTPHGWVSRTRRETYDTLMSTEYLESIILVSAHVEVLERVKT